MTENYFCLHANFYQAPRGNPFADDEVPDEPEAAPYANFNVKAEQLCYGPNAEAKNFEKISFNLGATLGRWLEKNAPATHARITAADRAHAEQWSMGNALAQPLHHTILPLNTDKRDKLLQIRWGLMAFEHRFGHAAQGMWLPEMAVDLATLQALHECGVQFTILSQAQVYGADMGAGPYWIKLPSGEHLAVYVRDDWHSIQLAFAIQALGGAGRWARGTLSPLKRNYGRLLLLALDGETFGYHFLGEEHFLHWLLDYEAGAVGYEVTTLNRDLRDNPPTKEIEVIENTSWSCPHGIKRWFQGCECTTGDSRWKAGLRRALDHLADKLDAAYIDLARDLAIESWSLRENYYRVRLGELTEGQFLHEFGLARLTAPQSGALLALLLAQFYRQRMYSSSAFYQADLDRPEPRYALANALRALLLTAEVTSADLLPTFRLDLAQAVSGLTNATGAQMLDEVLTWAKESGAI